jgi:hypothetical protein
VSSSLATDGNGGGTTASPSASSPASGAWLNGGGGANGGGGDDIGGGGAIGGGGGANDPVTGSGCFGDVDDEPRPVESLLVTGFGDCKLNRGAGNIW